MLNVRLAAHRTAWNLLLLASIALVVAGCRQAPPDDLLARADALCKEQKWDDAIPLLKRHLLAHPAAPDGNVAAHFLLGQCYMFGGRLFTGPAEGELRLALRYFLENGKTSPFAEFSNEYFELRLHLEIAKVHLKRLQAAMATGAPPAVLREILARCKRAADEARQIQPDSNDVKQLDSLLDALIKPAGQPRPAPFEA